MSWTIKGNGTGEDLLYSQAGTPSLDLRFASTKSLNDYVSGNNIIAFTRASTGTFVGSNGLIQTAAINAPRFDHNPQTGESLGLLLEEARTNLLLNSEEFGTTWTPTNLTVTSNSVVAPNGTTTADTLVEDTATSTHVLQQSASVVSGTTYTLSCYAKPAGRNFAQLLMLGGFAANITAIIDITNGTVGTTAGSPTVTSVNVGNGWYRLSITATATSTTSTAVQLRPSSTSSSAFYQGDGTSGIYIWGAQLEAGAFPTSYIPTTTAAVTRSADLASITGSNFSSWYRQDEGTMFAEGAVAQPVSGGNQFVFRSSDNTFNNAVAINIPGAAQLTTAAGGVFDGSALSLLFLVANVPSKIAGAYASNNLGISLNGATAVTDATVTIPLTQTRADIGSDHIGVNRVKAGTIKRLTYWPTRLGDEVLQRITQP